MKTALSMAKEKVFRQELEMEHAERRLVEEEKLQVLRKVLDSELKDEKKDWDNNDHINCNFTINVGVEFNLHGNWSDEQLTFYDDSRGVPDDSLNYCDFNTKTSMPKGYDIELLGFLIQRSPRNLGIESMKDLAEFAPEIKEAVKDRKKRREALERKAEKVLQKYMDDNPRSGESWFVTEAQEAIGSWLETMA